MTQNTDKQNATKDEALSENELIELRKEKLQALREQGNAYPNKFKRDHVAACLHASLKDKDNAALEKEPVKVKVAGRVMLKRLMGKAAFVQIKDMSGTMQIYLRKNDLPEGSFDEAKKWDLGDIIGIEGEMFFTKTGELTVKAKKVHLLAKSLRPLPDKFHGLASQELKYRKRYVDLIVNDKTREIFKIRGKIIQALRDFLLKEKFLEVETPMMHPIPGGATARPFVTFHNTLDMELFLRIAPELYLKRLIVGGFERVFEINRNFRNEGISTRHNPEFTMVEFYQAYADYKDLMELTERLFKFMTEEVLGKTTIEYQGVSLDFSKPFQRMTIIESMLEYNKDLKLTDINSIEAINPILKKHDISVQADWGLGKCQLELFEATVEEKLTQPTFITAYPTEVSPLARQNDDNPDITDRFELFIAGRELANGFSELNDAQEQAKRFKLQTEAKLKGDFEAMHYDADYIEALEYGMPPTAGEGIGIDRLAMLFTDSPSIREVILFPQLRDK